MARRPSLAARLIVWSICAVVALLLIEALAQVAFRWKKGAWFRDLRAFHLAGMLEAHPHLAYNLAPGVQRTRNGVQITHNSWRQRGPDFARPKPAGRRRVVTIGGSSTYCTGVSDDAAWPTLLGAKLGAGWDVVNMGMPGGTSVEASILTALLLTDVEPDFVIYYMGWNDAHVQHMAGQFSDWSDTHGRWAMGYVRDSRELNTRTATGYFVGYALSAYLFPDLPSGDVLRHIPATADALTNRVDQRALGLYERNMRHIAALCREQKIEPVFAPQILNYAVLDNDEPNAWLPQVRNRDMKALMGVYNESLARIAREKGVRYAGEVLAETWSKSDFLDQGHFSRAGNERFAAVLAKVLAEMKRE